MNFNYTLEDKILNICSNEYNYFLSKQEILGVGLGYKIKNGVCTFKKCIKVFARRKINKNHLNKKNLVPSEYKGILTDIVETGPISCCKFSKKIRPTLGGYSIGTCLNVGSGSIGCLVKDSYNYYILSCNHVLADENTVPIGTIIVQPGAEDGGKASKDYVCNLSKYIPLKFITSHKTPSNYADCAIAKIINKSLASPKIAILGTLKGIGTPILESYVEKAGRTSELTLGQISSIGATVQVDFLRGRGLFKDQIITTKMSEEGDSGALLVDSKNYALGLLFGDTNTVSLFNPIKYVLNLLNVNLVLNY